MPRIALDTLARRMEAAYRGDRFHALRRNLADVRPEEWDVRPADWDVEVFGSNVSEILDPELSIGDLAMHVAGSKFMYVDRIFGDATLEWEHIEPPGRDAEALLRWLDEGHEALTARLAAVEDDAVLLEQRPAPWREPMTVEDLLGLIINHDIYHAGEVNRQRALIRGAGGWEPGR